MRRVLVLVVMISAALTGCGDDDEEAESGSQPTSVTTSAAGTSSSAPGAATTAATAVATTVAATAPPTTAKVTAANAIIEPETVAGIPLGSNKSAAIAVLGDPTTTGQDTDLRGTKYDYLRWSLSGNRGLTLNFRTESVTSPLLTDWIATAAGPATKLGVKVGDSAETVTAAYGPLQNFCCDSKISNLERGGGRMIVVVDNASQVVRQIIGGDAGYWSRSIAD